MLAGVREATGSTANVIHADAEFLAKQKIGPRMDLPTWVPGQGATAGFARLSNARAVKAGLTFRPVGVMAADTLAWFNARPEARRDRVT